MPKKILIVEDEANIRELLRLYLEREGYTVLEAENGVEGIKKWKSDKPDMLLLDVMMPVMDGWAVCREIRAESDVPIIMLTAKGEIDTPPKELELLYHLAATPNRVYTRNQLLDEVWGFDYFGDTRTVDVHVKRLREKLEGVSDKWELKTVWGVGYKFETKE